MSYTFGYGSSGKSSHGDVSEALKQLSKYVSGKTYGTDKSGESSKARESSDSGRTHTSSGKGSKYSFSGKGKTSSSSSTSGSSSSAAPTVSSSATSSTASSSSSFTDVASISAALGDLVSSSADGKVSTNEVINTLSSLGSSSSSSSAISSSVTTVTKERLTRQKENFSDKMSQQIKKYEARSAATKNDSMVQTLNTLKTANTNVDAAQEKVSALNDLIGTLKAGGLDSTALEDLKTQFASIVGDLKTIGEGTSYKGQNLFSTNFSLALPGAGDTSSQIQVGGDSLVEKPEPVSDLAPSQTINSISQGNYDSFGSKIFVNDKYLAVAAKDAATLNTNNSLDNKYNDGAIDLFDAKTGASLGRYSIGQAGGNFDTSLNDSKYFTGKTGSGNNVNYNNSYRNLNFGEDFDIEGDYMVVGAPSLDGKDKNGTAFLYDIKNEKLIKELKMPEGSTDTNFGKSVEISNGKVFVTSYSDKSKIYTFDMSGNSTGVINSPNGVNFLGADITSSNGNIIISSSKENTGGKDGAGAVYVYDSATNSLKYTLTSPKAGESQGFGSNVEAYGNILAVSEPMRLDDKSEQKAGNVHLFDLNTGKLVSTLAPTSKMTGGDKFGSAIAMSDKFIAVAAEGDDTQGNNAGAVHVFDKETGLELAKISKSGSDDFGSSLALDGNTLYIGASTDSSGSFTKAGAVHKYDISSLGGIASKYKQDVAAQAATNVVADGLDINYLKGLNFDDILSGDEDKVTERLNTVQKNLSHMGDYVTQVKAGLARANSYLESRVGNSGSYNYVADDGGGDDGTTIVDAAA